jgi:ferric-dicitrate binding protein FerR (iron transport regulator)
MINRNKILNELLDSLSNPEGGKRSFRYDPKPINDEADKDRILQEILAAHPKTTNQRFLNVKSYYLAAACSVGVLLIAGLFVFMSNFSDQQLSCENGEGAKFVNINNNKIVLNSGTDLFYKKSLFSSGNYVLNGEAYFDVINGEISIETSDIIIKVETGRFNVSKRGDKVILRSNDAVLYVYRKSSDEKVDIVYQGSELSIDKGIYIRSRTVAANVGSWTSGNFSYTGQNLYAVLDEVSRQFNIKIIYTNAKDASVTISFSRKDGWRPILDRLASSANFTYEYVPDENAVLLRNNLKV